MIRTIARTISIPTYLYPVLEELAKKEARSFSNIIVALILEALDQRSGISITPMPKDSKDKEELF